MTEGRNSSADVTAFFERVGYSYNSTAHCETCLFNGTCYVAKVLPTITTVDYNTGFAAGGQTLTLTGTSLDGNVVTVTIDGVPCDV